MPAPASSQCVGSETVTRGVRVSVAPMFNPGRSDPNDSKYVFNYRVRVTNESDQHVRLLARHWIIVDAKGEREEVLGEGVVGRQPELDPGATFEYTSFCPLRTAWGTMEGSYTLQGEYGDLFEAKVARFFLVSGAGD